MRPLLLLPILIACNGTLSGEPQGAVDGGAIPDSGITIEDSGARRDGGIDAGTIDAGSPVVDAGSSEFDGGTDAGVPRPDAGPIDAGMPAHCDGPLELPIPDCRPPVPPSTGDIYEDCVRRINQFRAECQCLPPLARWPEGESCADQHAEYDANGAGPHGGFRDRICSPGGRGQNECPGYRDGQILPVCLQQMWDEGPGEPFIEHGHYINMTNPAHSRVACGFYTVPGSGRVWSVQNFQ